MEGKTITFTVCNCGKIKAHSGWVFVEDPCWLDVVKLVSEQVHIINLVYAHCDDCSEIEAKKNPP